MLGLDWRRAAWLAVFWLAVFLVPACGDADGSSFPTSSSGPGAGGGDTRFHPAPNGMQLSETDACTRLHDAFQGRIQALGCIKTVRPCPSFVRAHYDPDCQLYDEGTVSACESYYAMQTCETLIEDDCVLVGYPETAPGGCP